MSFDARQRARTDSRPPCAGCARMLQVLALFGLGLVLAGCSVIDKPV
jgi:hypothetical protein